MMTKGIIILAVRNVNFGKMGVNLAVSIKLNNPDTHITLMHDEVVYKELSDREKEIFDNFIIIPKEYYLIDNKYEYGLLKMNLYYLSPYDITLYIDADTLMMQGKGKDINYYFDNIKDNNFLFLSTTQKKIEDNKYDKISVWSDINYIYNNFPELHNSYILTDLQASLVGFVKNDICDNIFNNSIDFFYKMKEKKYVSSWYNCIVDELLFSLALSLHYKEVSKNICISRHSVAMIFDNLKISKIMREYQFLSYACGTGKIKKIYEDFYNQSVQLNAMKWKNRAPIYLWKEKTRILHPSAK